MFTQKVYAITCQVTIYECFHDTTIKKFCTELFMSWQTAES